MTEYAMGFPAKYIQGPGTIHQIGDVAAKLGTSALVMADAVVRDLAWPQISESLAGASVDHHFELFSGECCRPEFTRIAEVGRQIKADIVIAVGGGKTLDAGKAAAADFGAEMISVPTIASTDAPVSSLAVEYNEQHQQVGAIFFNRAPSAVVVDSQIVANAPARLLAAGMGDGLATWYEARACSASGARNFHGGNISEVGLTLARLCRDAIIAHGKAAFDAVAENAVTDSVERVIEANTFLSGVGFENTGVAGAHALDGALTRFSENHDSQHGERVALGILMQLSLEGDDAEIELLKAFYTQVGLPLSLRDLGLGDLSDDEIVRLADLVVRDGSPIRKLPFEVTSQSVTAALRGLR
jgi:glycerol dehydrogenase